MHSDFPQADFTQTRSSFNPSSVMVQFVEVEEHQTVRRFARGNAHVSVGIKRPLPAAVQAPAAHHKVPNFVVIIRRDVMNL